jgi:hypothetical protein
VPGAPHGHPPARRHHADDGHRERHPGRPGRDDARELAEDVDDEGDDEGSADPGAGGERVHADERGRRR